MCSSDSKVSSVSEEIFLQNDNNRDGSSVILEVQVVVKSNF
jgi:hypothetical protein